MIHGRVELSAQCYQAAMPGIQGEEAFSGESYSVVSTQEAKQGVRKNPGSWEQRRVGWLGLGSGCGSGLGLQVLPSTSDLNHEPFL